MLHKLHLEAANFWNNCFHLQQSIDDTLNYELKKYDRLNKKLNNLTSTQAHQRTHNTTFCP
jgi:hypothetical protein